MWEQQQLVKRAAVGSNLQQERRKAVADESSSLGAEQKLKMRSGSLSGAE